MTWTIAALIVALVLLIGLVSFIVVAATRISEYEVRRQVSILAPAAVVFDEINTLANWETWSPLSPEHAFGLSYAGPPGGVGAWVCWAGGLGIGGATVTGSIPHECIELVLSTSRPVRATSNMVFLLREDGDMTTVTWIMSGRHGLIARMAGLLTDIDALTGDPFGASLQQLKYVAEGKVQSVRSDASIVLAGFAETGCVTETGLAVSE